VRVGSEDPIPEGLVALAEFFVADALGGVRRRAVPHRLRSLDAWRHQRVQRIDDTGGDAPWPDFAATAAAYGVRSTLSLPLTKTGEALGALNLSSPRLAAFVVLSGEFDLLNSGEIRTAMVDLSVAGVTDVAVDLSDVAFFDVTAINALVAAHNALTRGGARMVVLGLTPLTARLVTATHLDQFLPVSDPDGGSTTPGSAPSITHQAGRAGCGAFTGWRGWVMPNPVVG
jgi:anti-anti-sigma factor